MNPNIPASPGKRIVVAGGGFAGLKFASRMAGSEFQVVLLDKNNFHQFQPLFYQVATAGLEPSAISFPLRKIFQHSDNVVIRVAEILHIDAEKNLVQTSIGDIPYDILVIALGADTNFFGMDSICRHAIPMKSVAEALSLRNQLLQNFEDALTCSIPAEVEKLMNVVVVGGGPTGVEVSGTLAEMRKYILPKDYPELDFSKMKIHLIEASGRLLNGMSPVSSEKAHQYLKKLDVNVYLNAQVSGADGESVMIHNGNEIPTKTLVWAAGVIGNRVSGLRDESYARGNRLLVNRFNLVNGYGNIYALGDIAAMNEGIYKNGHPQMAQPAIQQAKLLSRNLVAAAHGKEMKPFSYVNKGTMATIGRNLAVVELPFLRFQGFFAWLTWMFVHLMAIVGVKNRLLIFINWFWNYITYDQSLRLIIKPYRKKETA